MRLYGCLLVLNVLLSLVLGSYIDSVLRCLNSLAPFHVSLSRRLDGPQMTKDTRELHISLALAMLDGTFDEALVETLSKESDSPASLLGYLMDTTQETLLFSHDIKKLSLLNRQDPASESTLQEFILLNGIAVSACDDFLVGPIEDSFGRVCVVDMAGQDVDLLPAVLMEHSLLGWVSNSKRLEMAESFANSKSASLVMSTPLKKLITRIGSVLAVQVLRTEGMNEYLGYPTEFINEEKTYKLKAVLYRDELGEWGTLTSDPFGDYWVVDGVSDASLMDTLTKAQNVVMLFYTLVSEEYENVELQWNLDPLGFTAGEIVIDGVIDDIVDDGGKDETDDNSGKEEINSDVKDETDHDNNEEGSENNVTDDSGKDETGNNEDNENDHHGKDKETDDNAGKEEIENDVKDDGRDEMDNQGGDDEETDNNGKDENESSDETDIDNGSDGNDEIENDDGGEDVLVFDTDSSSSEEIDITSDEEIDVVDTNRHWIFSYFKRFKSNRKLQITTLLIILISISIRYTLQ